MNQSTKKLTQTGLLLAICVASQFMKNLSVYVTGPIVNTTIILAVLFVGLRSGIFISLLSPLTALAIAPSPILMGIPAIIPCIMVGNVLLAVSIALFKTKYKKQEMSAKLRVVLGMAAGCLFKAAFMGVSISLILLPMFSTNIKVKKPEMLPGLIQTAKVSFSLTQLITAATGCLISYLIWLRLRDVVEKKGE